MLPAPHLARSKITPEITRQSPFGDPASEVSSAGMNILPELASHSLQRVSQPARLRLIETAGRQSQGITELML